MTIFFLYFIAGIIQEFLFTVNIRAIDNRNVLLAAATSFLTVSFGMVIFYNIIARFNNEQSFIAIGVYSFGIGVGTALGMKYHMGRRRHP